MFNTANLKKTYYYLKKNGIADTYNAVRERLYARTSPLYMCGYQYVPIADSELELQRNTVFKKKRVFSILVPMYETAPEFARAMIDSVCEQTYPHWELILADASVSNKVKDVVLSYSDSRIRYVRVKENRGISENTNVALEAASGEYIGLLDHDDLLTPDALYEVANALQNAELEGQEAAFVYSDEDKCDTNASIYYEPNIKPCFNFDLLLSNNYICHFLVMKAELIKRLRFRKEYDGAQDFDLLLRAYLEKNPSDCILNVNKVLYHWRCHELSTAANPQSKRYAYEAGKKAAEAALEVYLQRLHGDKQLETGESPESAVYKDKDGIHVGHILVRVVDTKHNGFYRVEYGSQTAEDIFAVRKDIGGIIGPVIEKNKITSGILDVNGECPYKELPAAFSGYMHRMVLQQECKNADKRYAVVRPGFHFDEVRLGYPFSEVSDENNKLNEDLIPCKKYKIFYEPAFKTVL